MSHLANDKFIDNFLDNASIEDIKEATTRDVLSDREDDLYEFEEVDEYDEDE